MGQTQMKEQFDNRKLHRIARDRILVVDGAMGTLIQSHNLTESDFRGDSFASHPCDLQGNNDLLPLTRPDIIAGIHRTYLEAGADIIKTNTFNASAVSQSDYQTEHLVYDMNLTSARLARECADEFSRKTPDQPRFVAGDLGPTNRSTSLSPDVEKPGYRDVSFDDLRIAYYEQARGLLDGGIDIFLVETVFDTLNAKAALFAIKTLQEERQTNLPVWVSGTITDSSGRTLSGQTMEAFWVSVSHADLFCVGLNCANGAAALRSYVAELSNAATTLVSMHPNAGLPDELGNYSETPEITADTIRQCAVSGLVNIVGGCCGTTPDHIRAIAAAVNGITPRQVTASNNHCYLSGLEPLEIRTDSRFVNIGERTNVAGSAKFARLIRENDYESALRIARKQIKGGAQVIDVNLDDPMLDAPAAMTTFLNLLAADPDISRVPVMIDSSDWEVIEAGLKCLQGRGIVNSISLREGEDEFLSQACLIRKYGAAVVVMAIDEAGQGDTAARKVEICTRAHDLLTRRAGFRPPEIIFDPGVFAIGTGINDHNDYAVAFLDTCRTIKQSLPGCLVSGGISNLSFAFRGNNAVREAMHSVFLYHAVEAGMDMGIVNAGQLAPYESVPQDLRERAEDLILNCRPDAAERLLATASTVSGDSKTKDAGIGATDLSVGERLAQAIVSGITDHIEDDTRDAIAEYGDALQVVEGPLMDGMNAVGDLFADGRMFLPHVIRSARVMKKAVSVLTPHLKETDSSVAHSRGRILLATVKGDVHDIGKNIAGVVLRCHGYDVIDLGVKVSTGSILDQAKQHNVDAVGLSGLISPSLKEMVHIAEEMERRGFTIPLLIGGATTSLIHTAVKIAPVYSGPVVYIRDASRAVGAVNAVLDDRKRDGFLADLREEYRAIRKRREAKTSQQTILSLDEARRRSPVFEWKQYSPHRPQKLGIEVIRDYPLEDIVPLIDWAPALRTFDLARTNQSAQPSDELLTDAKTLLDSLLRNRSLSGRAVIGLYPANSVGDDVEIYASEDRSTPLTTVRFLRQQQQRPQGRPNRCLADFIAPRDSGINDYLGAFVVSAGFGVDSLSEKFARQDDEYSQLLLRALADRLAEAFAQRMHDRVRLEFWGQGTADNAGKGSAVGIRPAPGYPACPDHTQKMTLFNLLEAPDRIGVTLTESYAMVPAASICGWYFSHPDSRYFGIGPIGEDQVTDYSKRIGLPVNEVRQWLETNLT